MISLQKLLLLFCNPLYLLFRIPSNQFILFLMIQIRNNYKFNIPALARKENRSKSSYLCNSFVTDQITKMHMQVQPITRGKKNLTSQSQIHTEPKETERHIYFSHRVT